MNQLRPGSGSLRCPVWLRWALVAAMSAAACRGALAQAPSEGGAQVVSIAAYRMHLEHLDALVAACQKQRNAVACNPAQVGADDRVQLQGSGDSQGRDVRYGWLRDLLDRAGKKEDAAAVQASPTLATKEPAPSVDALLTQAHERLSSDWKEASAAVERGPGYDAERSSLKTILAGKAYKGVADTSARERFLEWLANALDNALAKLAQFGSRSPWIALTLRALLVIGLCVGLVWALIRIERRSRIRLAPDPTPGTGAPSAREWQLWLADAHTMAEQDLWREAIHYLYWAAIARLESRGMWPADRARTPREYLGLLPASDARRSNLVTLTRSFERTWYGGREADSGDYQAAQKLAAELGAE